MKECGPNSCLLFIGDKNTGLLEAITAIYPQIKYQRCTTRFYRNMFSAIPRHVQRQEQWQRCWKLSAHRRIIERRLRKPSRFPLSLEMKLETVADKLGQGIDETLTYMDSPSQRLAKIRTNKVIERLNREIPAGRG